MTKKKSVNLVFVCSGAADVGELTDRAARQLDRQGLAAMSCLASIGARDEDILFNAGLADCVLLMDGCPKACARRTFEHAGLRRFLHFDLSEAGLFKGQSPVTAENTQCAVDKAAGILGLSRDGSSARSLPAQPLSPVNKNSQATVVAKCLLKPIGVIRSPFREASTTPIQSAMAKGAEGSVEVFPEFVPALQDLDGFERIWLLYWFDRAAPGQLVVTPFLDHCAHGVFATRSPCRPNPLGLSCVRLLGMEGGRLRISEVDILDDTPLLDLKPYVPAFDCFEAPRVGWLQNKGDQPVLADDRFERPRRS
jgi:tRNA-Thr(GGU) m(6)t(6)A37 methyltransferase TsaA